MHAFAARCAHCGYPIDAPVCPRCRGEIHDSGDGHRIRPGRRSWPLDVCHGFWSLFASAVHIWQRREYIGRLTAPIVANVVVLTGALLLLFWIPWQLFGGWISGADGWLAAAGGWLAAGAAFLAAAVVLWTVAPVLIEAVTSPFLDPLAEATEEAWAGAPMPAVVTGVWRGMLVGARSATQLLGIQLLLLVPLLLVSLTGIGALLAFPVAAFFNAVVWMDIPGQRRGYGLRERIRLLLHNHGRALGFGTAIQVGMLLPVFNLVLLTPAAAVAASTLYLHFDKDLPPRQSTQPTPPAK